MWRQYPTPISMTRTTTVFGLTIAQLLESRVYLGYEITSWDFRVRSFILGVKNRTYVYNLSYTVVLLKNALSVFFQLLVRRGFCAVINENEHFIGRLYKKFRFFYKRYFWNTRLYLVFRRLQRGTLTNKRMEGKRLSKFRIFPELCFISSPSESEYVINECQRSGIPSICMFESNKLPVNATYLLPCNEKFFKAVKLYVSLFFLMANKARLVRANLWSSKVRKLLVDQIRTRRVRWKRRRSRQIPRRQILPTLSGLRTTQLDVGVIRNFSVNLINNKK